MKQLWGNTKNWSNSSESSDRSPARVYTRIPPTPRYRKSPVRESKLSPLIRSAIQFLEFREFRSSLSLIIRSRESIAQFERIFALSDSRLRGRVARDAAPWRRRHTQCGAAEAVGGLREQLGGRARSHGRGAVHPESSRETEDHRLHPAVTLQGQAARTRNRRAGCK